MSDVFSAIVQRIHGGSSVQPVLPARFEPAPPAPDAWLDPGLFVGPSPAVVRATGPDETDARSPEVPPPAWGPRERREVLRQAIDAPRDHPARGAAVARQRLASRRGT